MLLGAIAVLFVVMTVLPIVRHDYWVIRACDFPRLQIATAGTAVLAVYVALWDTYHWWEDGLLGLLTAAVVYQAYWIYPYTPYAYRQVHETTTRRADDQLTVLVANVWVQNRDDDSFLDLVRRMDPDVVLALETNERWTGALTALSEEYPHVVGEPRESPYGMMLYARYPLHDATVRHLVDAEVLGGGDVQRGGLQRLVFALDPVDLSLRGLAVLAVLRVHALVAHLDAHVLERPFLALGVHAQGDRGARSESGQQVLVGIHAGIAAAGVLRLVDHDGVAARGGLVLVLVHVQDFELGHAGAPGSWRVRTCRACDAVAGSSG